MKKGSSCGPRKMAKGGAVKKMAKGGMMCSPRKKMAMGMKKGGAVRKYAEGGMVDDGGEFMKVAKPSGFDKSATAYMSTPETRSRARAVREYVKETTPADDSARRISEQDFEDSQMTHVGETVAHEARRRGNAAARKAYETATTYNKLRYEGRKREGKE